MKAQRQLVQVGKDRQRNPANGLLRHAHKQNLAQLGKAGAGQAHHAIEQQQADRQRQQRLLPGTQIVDHVFENNGHIHTGQFGQQQAAKGGYHPPPVGP